MAGLLFLAVQTTGLGYNIEPMALLFSVCLYTHNRAALLAQALESLCNQTLPPDQFEIIVVDNRSTDDTRRVVEDFCGFTGFDLPL